MTPLTHRESFNVPGTVSGTLQAVLHIVAPTSPPLPWEKAEAG